MHRRLIFLTLVSLATLMSSHLHASDSKRVFTDDELATMPAPGPNPFISYLPVEAEVDWDYWKAKMNYEARLRAEVEAQMTGRGLPIVDEIEPNDSQAMAQELVTFGTGDGEVNELFISGTIGAAAVPTPFALDPEDDGDINKATLLNIISGEVVTANDEIGNGPHGSAGSGSADFDFFEIQNVVAGDQISIRVSTANPSGDLDPNTAIWNSSGDLLGFNEDIDAGSSNFDSALTVTVPADGSYFLSIGGWKGGGQSAVLPGDPFDSSSGTGAASEGLYAVEIGLNSVDIDCFALNLEPGDLFGAGGLDSAERLDFFTANGELQIGSEGSGTFLYPNSNPLPSGTAAIDFVTYNSEQHALCVQGASGDYTVRIGAFRQIFEGSADKQILFIDFDGATINPSIFGNFPNEDRVLSPLSSFLDGWGLTPADEDDLIDAILESIEESITQDLALQSNPNFEVEIRNSRDHADTFGIDPNVSRVIVGGTIAESGISTIGIAQSIDPGNFEPGETGLTLLDLLSAPANDPNSLNQFIVHPKSSQIRLVAAGVGNITVHEAGHFLGNWHTENSNAGAGPSIMDRGGNLPGTVGVGDDEIFGSKDDIDVDFIPDLFSFAEGFSGTEHTNEKTAFALTSLTEDIFSDSFETPQ